MNRTYRIDGLRICLPIDLPLSPLDDAPDWIVEFGPEDAGEFTWTGEVSDGDATWARFGRANDRRVVRLVGVLDLVADRGGRTATIAPGGEDFAEAYLLRRAMPYLVHLAGGTALHAACAVVRGETWLYCGDSGVGKSTLALRLDADGHPVLADDHVALTRHGRERLHAEASFPFADAPPDAVRAYRPDVEPATENTDKQRVPLRTERPSRAPVDRIGFLARGDEDAMIRLPRPDVAARLLRDVIFVGDPASSAEQARRLDLAIRLADHVPAFTVVVPPDPRLR